jgi:hypothetical protein
MGTACPIGHFFSLSLGLARRDFVLSYGVS